MRYVHLVLMSTFVLPISFYGQTAPQTTTKKTHFFHNPAPCAEPLLANGTCPDVVTGAFRPITLYGASEVHIEYANIFRYDISSITNSAIIAAAAPPASLAPSATSAAVTAGGLNTGLPAAAPAMNAAALIKQGTPLPMPALNASVDPCSNAVLNITDATAPQTQACWTQIQGQVTGQVATITTIRKQINVDIRNATTEQRCYQVALKTPFSQPILSKTAATALITFALANEAADSVGGCRQDVTDWPLDDADDVDSALIVLQSQLTSLATSLGFQAWTTGANVSNLVAYTALQKQVTDLLTEVNGYVTGTSTTNTAIGSTYSAFEAMVDSNNAWRSRLTSIAEAPGVVAPDATTGLPALIVQVLLPKCQQWYGRGRTDTISLQYTDVATAGSTQQSLAIGTNTCNPLSIVSTGVGVTFLPSPVYGFIAGDNTGAQVIGKSAVNDISPLFDALYNVQIAPLGRSGIELFGSPGVGFTSASNTTTTDFLAGLSLSFGRRLIFVTGSADFGRRDDLAPGFAIGTPKGSLSSVPTQSSWKAGAMFSISFGVGPS